MSHKKINWSPNSWQQRIWPNLEIGSLQLRWNLTASSLYWFYPADVIPEIQSTPPACQTFYQAQEPKAQFQRSLYANDSSTFISRPDLSAILLPPSLLSFGLQQLRCPPAPVFPPKWPRRLHTMKLLVMYVQVTSVVLVPLCPCLPTEMLTRLQSWTQMIPPPQSFLIILLHHSAEFLLC